MQRVKDLVVEDNSVRGQIVGNGLYNATFSNNVVVQAAATQYAESGVSPLMTLGFVSGANVTNNSFRSAGSWADFVSGSVPTVLPVGISVWGSIWDRFRGTAAADGGTYYRASTDLHITHNNFIGEFSGPNWLHRQDHVSPQGLVSLRTINLNGVSQVVLRGNAFKVGNVTDNLCACCVVVETADAAARCTGVVASAARRVRQPPLKTDAATRNIFGIGTYYPPSRNVQHAFARNLTGEGGWITVTVPGAVGASFSPGKGTCKLPPGPTIAPATVTPANAMLDAYARNLSVVLIFQPFYLIDGCGPAENQTYHPSLYIRDLSDDSNHTVYTKVSQHTRY